MDTYLIPFTKTTSNWITDLSIKGKTIKLLEDNPGENLGELGYGDSFSGTTPDTGLSRGMARERLGSSGFRRHK